MELEEPLPEVRAGGGERRRGQGFLRRRAALGGGRGVVLAQRPAVLQRRGQPQLVRREGRQLVADLGKKFPRSLTASKACSRIQGKRV